MEIQHFAINVLASEIHAENVAVGWWDNVDMSEPMVVPCKLALIHSEISEALEGHRKNLMDDKIPSRKMLEVELADAIIRILDLSAALNFDIGGAIFEKCEYNKTRLDHKRETRQLKNGKSY